METIKSPLTSDNKEVNTEDSFFDDMSQMQFDLWFQTQLKDVKHLISKRKPVKEHALVQHVPEEKEIPISQNFISYILSRQK